jgi:hypothetical protein
MATRRIPQDEVLFAVTNYSSGPVIAGNRRVNPGRTEDVPVRYIANRIDSCQALATLMTKGLVAVAVKFSGAGLVGAQVDANYILGLQAQTAGVYGMQPSYATADLPAATDVPVGWGAYDETLTKPQYSDGSAYKDGAGA